MPNRIRRPVVSGRLCALVASCALSSLAACGGQEPDAEPNFTGSFAGASGAVPGATAGSGGAGNGGNPGLAGAAAGGSGGREGNGGSLGLAGSAGSNAGSGGGAPGPGRVGAELCPPGPFVGPLSLDLNQRIVHLASVGGNGSFNWEGVVWVGDALLFSEIADGDASQINRYVPGGSVQRGVFPGSGSNGLALDAFLTV